MAFFTLAVASASYLASDPFPRRGLNIVITPPNGPPDDPPLTIPVNLTNAQLETVYAAQCAAVNTATGQGQILADIRNATANSIAIDVGPNSTVSTIPCSYVT